ncbi:NAD(P)-binding domain-containing protein [Candidatus Uhrbacteria bacterium]|nr:NAD(P)-binding domain-containing protein [Candidatus Uhrbacteria bacterium]
MRVAIIGYGEIGKALYALLKRRKDLVVERWDKDETKVSGQKSLEETLREVDVVFLCVQSWIVRDALVDCKRFLKRGSIVVCLAKGIERGTRETMDQVMSDVLPKTAAVALLSGPMLADELQQGLSAGAVIAARSKKTFVRLQKIFHATTLLPEYSSDVRGVALAGVLKNTYAMFLGIVDALKLGLNMKGVFTARSLAEMRKLMTLLGGSSKTVDGVGCLGDLVATAYSAYSRNRRYGEEIVKRGVSDVRGEGIASFDSLIALVGSTRERYPILSALYAILIKKRDAQKVVAALSRS